MTQADVPAPRRVLVTGGSRGIGAAIVEMLARRSADVMFTYRSNAAAADKVVDAARDLPGSVCAVQHDLLGCDADSLIAGALSRIGGLDSLILNAGIWRGGRLGDLPEQDWWSVVETNVRGNAAVARAGLAELGRSEAGSVTMISSVVGLTGFAGDTAYGSSKAAMIGFARSLAKEVGKLGIRVNVLAPGFVETDMTAQISERSRDRIAQRSLLGRFGTAAEIAQAAVFLSEDATYATGVVLPIDGGWTL